ncbi:MAG TPA: Gldg family protein [Kofleriaceae bacterium]
MSLHATYWVFRRELHGMLRAPIIYVVGGVFLVVQGVAFAGLVGALSDPRRPAPLGALLEGQLAGTLLTWVLSLVVLALLGMRAIADDKRSGAWELLLTAQVGEGAAVVGKWLAAAAVYALLWIPTLAYLAIVALYRADDGGWDLGAIAAGYLGAIAIGAALLAWAIAASAATSSILVAGALGFAWLVGLFLLGELPGLWPDLAIDHPALAGVFEAISIRRAALAFARGELTLSSIVLIGGLAVTGLSLAITLACGDRRRRREIRIRAGGTIALAMIATLAGALAARFPVRIDVSASGRNSLDPATRDVLAAIPAAKLTIVRPTIGALEPVFVEIERVARQMAEHAAIEVHTVDPAGAPGGLAAVARTAGLVPNDLAIGGAVIVDVGGRRRVVELPAIATVTRRADEPPEVERLVAEQALAGALAALAMTRSVQVCVTTGHAELPLSPRPDTGADWSIVAERLRADGLTVEEVAIEPAVPTTCDVLLVAGPGTPLSASEALAIQTYVRAGKALIVAAPSRTVVRGGVGATGLEAVLASDGLGLPAAIAIDPTLALRELPGSLLVVDGYADHPINTGFAARRATIWFQPRAVLAQEPARPLVVATSGSWGERDFESQPDKGPDDLAGPIALAAIGGSGRVIAIGSAESLSAAMLSGGASAADLWLARAVRFVTRSGDPTVSVAERTPDQVRLVLTSGQRNAIIALSVGGIPVAWLLLGGFVVWWRRRGRE